jgi:hypothetical protein
MIEKIDNNQIPDALKESSAKKADIPKIPAEEGDVSLQANYDSLIEKAKEIPPEDSKAVQRAQQLLSSGQLDTPENIRAAAENIIKYGI